MKVRTDFVTNSSSSSFIVCFARVSDKEKAQKILDKYEGEIEIYTGEEALAEVQRTRYYSEWLEWDWAGINATPSKKYILQHIDDNFVVVTDCHHIYADEDGYLDYNVDYDDFDTEVIDCISEENGFADIEIQWGAGRDG